MTQNIEINDVGIPDTPQSKKNLKFPYTPSWGYHKCLTPLVEMKCTPGQEVEGSCTCL